MISRCSALIDRPCAHDRGNVLDRAYHPRVEDGRTHPCGIRINEADNRDPEIAPLVQLAGEADGPFARAHEEQSIARADAPHCPLEHEAPAENERDDQTRGDGRNAAANHQVGEPEIGCRQD